MDNANFSFYVSKPLVAKGNGAVPNIAYKPLPPPPPPPVLLLLILTVIFYL